VDSDFESRVRSQAFSALRARQQIYGEVLPSAALAEHIVVDGRSIAIANTMSGIHKPAQLTAALTLTTTPPKRSGGQPYADRFDEASSTLRYHYRDPRNSTLQAARDAERDNNAVRAAMSARLPLIYLFGVESGKYLPFFPVFVVGDDPSAREFLLDVADHAPEIVGEEFLARDAPARRYRLQVIKARMHQSGFRSAVLKAYRNSCAVCSLQQERLVEAAHIVPDSEGGPSTVTNGLGLCKLHHAAYDHFIIGIHPEELTVAIRTDILKEIDGPMLKHGLQEFHGQKLRVVPKNKAAQPSRDFREARWSRFTAA
jgi:putative restriction endonuclease